MIAYTGREPEKELIELCLRAMQWADEHLQEKHFAEPATSAAKMVGAQQFYIWLDSWKFAGGVMPMDDELDCMAELCLAFAIRMLREQGIVHVCVLT